MPVKFQYNKTSLQDLNRQLKVRVGALPTLKNKEAALRLEVKKLKAAADHRSERLRQQMKAYEHISVLWQEYDPSLLSIAGVDLSTRKIAGVQIPELQLIHFVEKEFSLFNSPYWIADGLALMKELATISLERQVKLRAMELLEHARKKTTQKVNLYEKVQIPGYEEAILKIKRFLEDEENLSKSAQKIVKNRQQIEADTDV
jgi:V/A-type H+/Na+-transporting ATPase subunit D